MLNLRIVRLKGGACTCKRFVCAISGACTWKFVFSVYFVVCNKRSLYMKIWESCIDKVEPVHVYVFFARSVQCTILGASVQGGQGSLDALSCRSFSAKEPLIIGLFCRKWRTKIRHPRTPRHPVVEIIKLIIRNAPRRGVVDGKDADHRGAYDVGDDLSYISKQTYIYIHTYRYRYMYVYIHIYTCVHIHTCDLNVS